MNTYTYTVHDYDSDIVQSIQSESESNEFDETERS